MRRQASLVFLDTHAVIWLFNGNRKKFSKDAWNAIAWHPLRISPIVVLELQNLYDIGRVRSRPHEVLDALRQSVGLEVARTLLTDVVEAASSIRWTRDVCDLLIVAEAAHYDAPLITADTRIQEHYSKALC